MENSEVAKNNSRQSIKSLDNGEIKSEKRLSRQRKLFDMNLHNYSKLSIKRYRVLI